MCGHIFHLPETSLLKGGVADGKHFVNQQNLRFKMGSNGKGKSQMHSRRVVLDRRIDEFSNLGKLDYLFKFPIDLPTKHPKNRSVQIDIFTTRQLKVKAGSNFKQRSHSSADNRFAGRWLGDAG